MRVVLWCLEQQNSSIDKVSLPIEQLKQPRDRCNGTVVPRYRTLLSSCRQTTTGSYDDDEVVDDDELLDDDDDDIEHDMSDPSDGAFSV